MLNKISLMIIAAIAASSSIAQYDDSTGTNRLFVSPESKDGTYVPDYGNRLEGTILKAYSRTISSTTCFKEYENGLCVVRNGAGGYSGNENGVWKQFCPVNSYNLYTGGGSSGNICGGD